MTNTEIAARIMRASAETTLEIIESFKNGEITRDKYIHLMEQQTKWLQSEIRKLA